MTLLTLLSAPAVAPSYALLFHTAGRDWAAGAMFDRSGSRSPAAGYLGVAAGDYTPPAAGDTALAGEVTTVGGGLVRKAATYAHTTGAATATLTATFTGNGSDALPVSLSKIGVFTALSGGVMPFSALLYPVAQIPAVGASATLTAVVTLG